MVNAIQIIRRAGHPHSLTVKKNYESYAQKLKDLAKENPGNKEKDGTGKPKGHKKRLFAYSFAIISSLQRHNMQDS
jgi:hypothetical protein